MYFLLRLKQKKNHQNVFSPCEVSKRIHRSLRVGDYVTGNTKAAKITFGFILGMEIVAAMTAGVMTFIQTTVAAEADTTTEVNFTITIISYRVARLFLTFLCNQDQLELAIS